MGPICHLTASKQLSKVLKEYRITYNSGRLLDNITPDFEASHAYNFKTNTGQLFNLIKKCSDNLAGSQDDQTIRFLLHYTLDGLSVGQLHEDFWVKRWGVCKDDLFDLMSEFVSNKTEVYTEPVQATLPTILDMYYEYSKYTLTYYYDRALKGYDFIPEMTKRAVSLSVQTTTSIILRNYGTRRDF